MECVKAVSVNSDSDSDAKKSVKCEKKLTMVNEKMPMQKTASVTENALNAGSTTPNRIEAALFTAREKEKPFNLSGE